MWTPMSTHTEQNITSRHFAVADAAKVGHTTQPLLNGIIMSMTSSKIELTDRLRQLGIWGVASWYKDQCQRRLRASGVSRREANERAWVEMSKQFDGQNLERYLITEFMTMGEFPPSIKSADADLAHEIPFNYIWRLWCLCLARLECWESDDFEMASLVSMEMSDNTLDGYEQFASLAVNEPNRFVVGIAAPKFVAVTKRLAASSERQDEYVDELTCHINGMKRFGFKELLDSTVVGQPGRPSEARSHQNRLLN